MDTSARLIDFLSKLHGMIAVPVTSSVQPSGALDIESGIEYRAHSEHPDGDLLLMRWNGEQRTAFALPIIEFALLRHAKAMSIIDGGTAERQLLQIKDHLKHKVGL